MHDPECNDPTCPGYGLPQPKFVVKTSCGHDMELDPAQGLVFMEYTLKGLALGGGATFDCPTCGHLEVTQLTQMTIHTRGFHEWMNSKDPAWPADGSNTTYIEGQDAEKLMRGMHRRHFN